MIKVENISVWGFGHAIRGMRNSMNSWDKSDTIYGEFHGLDDNNREILVPYNPPRIGNNDLDLMKKLYQAGVEHRTYARMIQVSMNVTAPLYWWKEADRYSVGKTQISTSTMHRITDKEFELNDFSHEHLSGTSLDTLVILIDWLNGCRESYAKYKHKEDWWQIIQLLPSSYNQLRTIMMSYEVVFKIIKERTGHKLDEWDDFVKVLKNLPYVEEIKEGEKNDR